MSPKVADPSVRAALVETAARQIAAHGTTGLTLRRLAQEAGTSTMAVYTHFGSMTELRREVRREGFARLRGHLAAVVTTDDPVADLAVLGIAYYRNGVSNPHLYRVMFQEAAEAAEADDAGDREVIGLDTFASLVAGVQRCLDAGRFATSDAGDAGRASTLAIQAWAMAHGVVSLQLANMLTPDQALDALAGTGRHLFVGFGDQPERAEASGAAAALRFAEAG